MPDPAERHRHRRRTLLLAFATAIGTAAVTAACILLAGTLDQYRFLRFPLGFYILAQGLLLGMVAVCFWFASIQERIDRALEDSEEL